MLRNANESRSTRAPSPGTEQEQADRGTIVRTDLKQRQSAPLSTPPDRSTI
jgi:hypothetical protein